MKKNKKKILILMPAMNTGGVTTVLINYLKNIDLKNFQFVIYTLSKGSLDHSVRSIDKNIILKNIFINDPRKYHKNIYRLIKWISILVPSIFLIPFQIFSYKTVICFHDPLAFYLKFFRAKKYLWIHSDYGVIENIPEITELKKTNGKLAKHVINRKIKLYSKINKIIFVSEDIKANFAKRFKTVNKESMLVINNPLEKKSIAAMRSIDELKNFSFCSIGRISHEKCYDKVIKSIGRLKKNNINVKLDIVGDGPDLEYIKSLSKELQIDDLVTFHGHLDDPSSVISHSNYLICTSKYEAYSMVALEAVSMAVPIITTNCSGMKEIIGEPPAGMIVGHTINEIYEAMYNVYIDKTLDNFHQKNAYKRSIELNENIPVRLFQNLLMK